MSPHHNHRALVTGATSGIGRATVDALVAAGARVAAVGRSPEHLADLAREHGAAVHPIAGDLRDPDARARVADSALAALGGLDLLVNAAGVIASGTIETTTLADWQEMFELNVTAAFDLMARCTPALKESKGAVVNVSSVTGLRAFPGVLAYCASKAALDQLTRCAALELAPAGVRCNAVNPGVVVTGLHKNGGMDEARYATFLAHSTTTHPMGRVGDPAEVAELILFLGASGSAWITGATVPIDGGRHLTCAR